MDKIFVLGISAFYHDAAAALICDGEIVAASSEERFTRIKADASFPIHAVTFCLDKAGIMPNDLAAVVFYEEPVEKFGRLLTSAFIGAPKSIVQFTASMPEWISSKLWIEKQIRKQLGLQKGKVTFLPHHLSHAASAFYPSPFDEAAILTVDGVGEWTTLSWGVGKGNDVTLTHALRFPNSLGLLYSAFTFYTGFRINEGEYKMMGLAPYGEPIYADLIKKELIYLSVDGSFVLNQKYFSYAYGVKTINKRFESLFGRPPRKENEPIDSFHADIAASIQQVTNEILLNAASHIRKETGQKNLVMAGGVALNVTSTGLLRASGIFDNIWIQPAAGDAGGAVGAAMHAYYRITDAARTLHGKDRMQAGFLGYAIRSKNKKDDAALKVRGAVWTNVGKADMAAEIATLVDEGKIVAVAQDRAEFGPRALGNRSILADARDPEMLQHLNARIKFREGFRPFAPAVLAEDAAAYFDIGGSSPYMSFTFPVRESRRKPATRAQSITETASLARSDIPAVTHVDYSARIETVDAQDNPNLHAILTAFKQRTGCSVMINTSFNVNHQPIVNTAAEAYDTFMRSGIDFAFIGERRFDKADQTPTESKTGSHKAKKPEPANTSCSDSFAEFHARSEQKKELNTCSWFGLILGAVLFFMFLFKSFSCIGTLSTVYAIAASLGGLCFLAGGFFPLALKPLVRLAERFGDFVGKHLLRAMMIPVYFLMLIPAIFLRRGAAKRYEFAAWDDPCGFAPAYLPYPKNTYRNSSTGFLGTLNDLLLFLSKNRLLFLLPIVILLVVLGLVFFFISANSVFSFIYALF